MDEAAPSLGGVAMSARSLSRQKPRSFALLAVLLLSGLIASGAGALDFVEFESGPVKAVAMNGDATELYVANIPDGRLEIFHVTDVGLLQRASVPVGLEPVTVAVAPDGLVWVANHLSDSVSVVDPALDPPQVVHTLLVGDEPRGMVFAGNPARAFISTAHRGQHRTHASISTVVGAGDPQLTTPGVPRLDVWVFDPANLGTTTALGGRPTRIMEFYADTGRDLTVSPDGNTVYVAGFMSGNQTTAIPELVVCDGFDPGTPCQVNSPLGTVQFPGGVAGPDDNADGDPAPETGIIVKFDGSGWIGPGGNDWGPFVNFSLPDFDVFAVDANTLNVGQADIFTQVGTVLFNLAPHPTNGKVYVSNTELPNHIRFEGPGNHGGSTVQGHVSESRISILSGTNTVTVRHLNKHIDYSRLHTDVPDLVDVTAKEHSLATPLDMVFDSTGATLYVAAYGSKKIGVFDTAALEADTFDPTVDSADYISAPGGGPNGLVLDEGRGRLYFMTRFDNAMNVVELASGATIQVVPLHNPEPQSVVDGRPMLYDASETSGNGEASCASCHIFGDVDHLAWNLGNPDAPVTTDTQPALLSGNAGIFHPMKGPMTTQPLKGLSTHGAMHWRGDRVDGIGGTDPCTEPTGAPCSERHSFNNFREAFEGLLGMEGLPTPAEMNQFTDFILQVFLPPNPVRRLNNSLTPAQAAGLAKYNAPNTDGGVSCNGCHVIDPSNGFFGTSGFETFEGEPQNMKVPHMRTSFAKVGMFGMFVEPNGLPGGYRGPQVRGFGFLHDGVVATLQNFVSGQVFTTTFQEELNLEQFMLAFPTDLAPAVGQQVTLDGLNQGVAGGRVGNFRARANATFESLTLGGTVTECDLIARGTIGGVPRAWLNVAGTTTYTDDTGAVFSQSSLDTLAGTEGPVTYTCATPGSGVRLAHNRDRDLFNDSVDNCPGAANDSQTDTDGDNAGDACDQDDDGDTLLDYYETNTGVFNSAFDTGTNALLADTDSDGLDDGVETNTGVWTSASDTGTNPLVPDSDGDGLLDGVETNTATFVSASDTGTSPLVADSDGDGLLDGAEVTSGTNPTESDTDGDGLLDGVETNTSVFVSASNTGTNPLVADTDGDGIDDGAEVSAGTDPNDPADPSPPGVPALPLAAGALLAGGLVALMRRVSRGRA